MSNPITVDCVLVFNNQGEREVQSVRLLVNFNTHDEAKGFFAALAAREPITVTASALKFYDRAFKVADRDAAQYRSVSEFGR